MDPLKFFVLDEEDLGVVSTHLQDAVTKASGILWRPQEKRLVARAQPVSTGKVRGPKPRNIAAVVPRCALNGCWPAKAVASNSAAGDDPVLNLLAVEFVEADEAGPAW